jgi:hypothetical protein
VDDENLHFSPAGPDPATVPAGVPAPPAVSTR